MLDYAAWLKRALAFLERLSSFPGKVGIEKEVAPPFPGADVEAFARACKVPLPEPLRRFWTSASRYCRCTYWWETPEAFHRQLGVAFPEKSPSTLNGGPEFAAPEYLLSFVNTTTTVWGADGNRITFPRDTRYWEGSFPLIPAGNGDYVGLYFRENPENPPVVYLCHEGCGGSGIIARDFDEFLVLWERLGYIDVDMLLAFVNRKTGLLDPDSLPVQPEAMASLLRAEARPDLTPAPLTFTEEEWLSSRDPTTMMTWLERGNKLDERKLRLFGCACCRRIWNRLTEAAQDEGAELHRLSNIHGVMRQAVLTVVDRRFMSRLITWEITQHLDEPEYSIELAAIPTLSGIFSAIPYTATQFWRPCHRRQRGSPNGCTAVKDVWPSFIEHSLMPATRSLPIIFSGLITLKAAGHLTRSCPLDGLLPLPPCQRISLPHKVVAAPFLI